MPKLLLLFLLPVTLLNSTICVTYELDTETRFGDQLVSYLNARWIAYHYGYSFLYKPFRYSENFALDALEERWSEEKEKGFDQQIRHEKGAHFLSMYDGSLLYKIPFFSSQPDDLKYKPDWAVFPIHWKDPGFNALLRSLFQPAKKLDLIALPKEKYALTVALHVRRGGGVDDMFAHILWPLRFPPDSYYIESLRKMAEFFPNQSIYAFIFTDEEEPQKIASKLQEALSDLPITLGYRETGNHHSANVIEDFYSMMQFDCLIRSTSNFSLIPSVIGNYKVVITPQHHLWHVNEDFRVENYIDEFDYQFSSYNY